MRDLRETLLGDYLAAAAALATALANDLPEAAREQVGDAMATGAARLELRLKLETREVELLMVPTVMGPSTWLARTTLSGDPGVMN